MAHSVQIIIPTYQRPEKLLSTKKQLVRRNVIWVCHESDTVSQGLLKNPVIDYQSPSGVNATNAGFWAATSDWIVIGQDDFTWHDDWLEKVFKRQEETGAFVVGFNDGYEGNRPEHSVAWLIYRPYAMSTGLCIGFPNVAFNPHYKKNFSDNELCETARYQKVWAYAKDALLEHLHPSFGKSSDDSTYQHLEPYFEQDYNLYLSRKHLWS